MIVLMLVGRELACFYPGRAFEREFGYYILECTAELVNRYSVHEALQLRLREHFKASSQP